MRNIVFFLIGFALTTGLLVTCGTEAQGQVDFDRQPVAACMNACNIGYQTMVQACVAQQTQWGLSNGCFESAMEAYQSCLASCR